MAGTPEDRHPKRIGVHGAQSTEKSKSVTDSGSHLDATYIHSLYEDMQAKRLWTHIDGYPPIPAIVSRGVSRSQRKWVRMAWKQTVQMRMAHDEKIASSHMGGETETETEADTKAAAAEHDARTLKDWLKLVMM